jgi:hypothetical protein
MVTPGRHGPGCRVAIDSGEHGGEELRPMQEQQQGENRVKSMLFHMFGEGALLTTFSKRRSPPGVDVPGGWICRHRAQPNSSHIPLPHGHLGAAVAFGKGAVGEETLPACRSWRSISAAADCFSGT